MMGFFFNPQYLEKNHPKFLVLYLSRSSTQHHCDHDPRRGGNQRPHSSTRTTQIPDNYGFALVHSSHFVYLYYLLQVITYGFPTSCLT